MRLRTANNRRRRNCICPICEKTARTANRRAEIEFVGTVVVFYIPVITCRTCRLSYTDDRSVRIKENAISKATGYRISKDGKHWIEPAEEST